MTGQATARVLMVTLFLGLTAGCSGAGESHSHQAERRRDGGAAALHRVVTLTPSATEIVAELAGTSALVGVDKYSVYPPAVKKLPKVGSFLTPNIEVIISLKPTLVVLDAVQAKYRRALETARIPVLTFRMHTIDDVKTALTALGKALGAEKKAAAAVQRLGAAVDESSARARRRAGATRPKVLIVIDREPGNLGRMVVAGPGSFLDELLAIVGGANAMSSAGSKYVNISREQVMQTKPDIIIETMRGRDAGRAQRDWKAMPAIPAVKRGRVHSVDDQIFVSPGPRLVQALAAFERFVMGNASAPQ